MSGWLSRFRKKPQARRFYVEEESDHESVAAPAPAASYELTPLRAPAQAPQSNEIREELTEAFQFTLRTFIAKHVLSHDTQAQRHFKNIVAIFMSSEKALGEKLIEITVQLQHAEENPNPRRSTETAHSYRGLYQSLYLDFSEAFIDGAALLSKVKRLMGRIEGEPGSFFAIEDLPRSDALRIEDLSAEGTGGGAEETKAGEPTGEGTDALDPIPLCDSAPAPDFAEAEAFLYLTVANHFLNEGDVSTDHFRLIRSCLRPAVWAALKAKNIEDTQVLLYSATQHEVGSLRSNKTWNFYETLQNGLYERAFNEQDIRKAHAPYRTALLARRAEEARRVAEAAVWVSYHL